MITLLQGDCIHEMGKIKSSSVHLVLTDPPYGITDCKWDTVIHMGVMWWQLKRILKWNGVIALTSSQPFTTDLICSNRKMFRYHWVWLKNRKTGFAYAKNQPMRCVEDVLIFYAKKGLYNPQGLRSVNKWSVREEGDRENVSFKEGSQHLIGLFHTEWEGYPDQVLRINSAENCVHPTQKPVELMEYMIKTYTNKGETVLDFSMGSGTTGVACQNLGRKFIGIELDPKYFQVAQERIYGAIE